MYRGAHHLHALSSSNSAQHQVAAFVLSGAFVSYDASPVEWVSATRPAPPQFNMASLATTAASTLNAAVARRQPRGMRRSNRMQVRPPPTYVQDEFHPLRAEPVPHPSTLNA
jgi:hypothetical protein